MTDIPDTLRTPDTIMLDEDVIKQAREDAKRLYLSVDCEGYDYEDCEANARDQDTYKRLGDAGEHGKARAYETEFANELEDLVTV